MASCLAGNTTWEPVEGAELINACPLVQTTSCVAFVAWLDVLDVLDVSWGLTIILTGLLDVRIIWQAVADDGA